MGPVVYFLCAVTCLVCFVLLLRSWRASRARLLFWSALYFAGMTINNIILVLDKLFVERDLSTPRLSVALVAVLLLVYGLVSDEE